MRRDGERTDVNIVLMVSDDHGREAVGCYGNDRVRTPNLDRLAGEGVRFENAFCTAATCSASRATILTGLYGHANGMYGLAHACHHFSCFDDVSTLPALMRAGGYRTGRVGKKHYAPERLFPFDWDEPDAFALRDDVAMSESCRDFVSGTSPFFLYWCSHNPHRSGPDERHPLRPDAFGNPRTAFPGDREEVFPEKDVRVPAFLSDLPEVRAELAQYYQSIARLDRGIGRLLSILEDAGKLDNTVILYLSDNGAAFPEAKTTLYEPGMRLPCIVRGPRHKARGTVCDGLINWADITPTVLDFAGLLNNPGMFQGNSFMEIMDRASPSDWRDEIYASHSLHEITNYYPMRAVRTRRHKFIWNIAWKLDYPFASDLWYSASWQAAIRNQAERFGRRSMDAFIHRSKFELYDLENDPDEVENLAENPGYADLVEGFVEKVKAFQSRTNDPWEHKWIYE